MRFKGAFVVLAAFLPCAAFAQAWIEYRSQPDHFSVNLPGQPTITEMPYMSEYGATLTARKYVVSAGGINYTVTVVDYRNALSLNDLRGAVAFAATALRQRGKVTYDAYAEIDRIPGHQLQITEPNGKRLYAGMNLYDKRLYILVAEAPPNVPPPEGFRASLIVYDDNGMHIRLDDNGVPLKRGGGNGGPGAAGPAPAGDGYGG